MTAPKKLVLHINTITKGLEAAFATLSPIQGWHSDTDRLGLKAVKLLALARTRMAEAVAVAERPNADSNDVSKALYAAHETVCLFADAYIGVATAATNIQVSEQRFDAKSNAHINRLIVGVEAFSKVLTAATDLVKPKGYDPKRWS